MNFTGVFNNEVLLFRVLITFLLTGDFELFFFSTDTFIGGSGLVFSDYLTIKSGFF
jgi:hypothetical protein